MTGAEALLVTTSVAKIPTKDVSFMALKILLAIKLSVVERIWGEMVLIL